jgi:hypothetical protein
MGISDDLLYKWLSNGEMKARMIPSFENVCGIHFVTEYLAAGAGRIVIEIPTGRRPDELALGDLQKHCIDAVAQLVHFYHGESEAEKTRASLTEAITDLVSQRENVMKFEVPELELAGIEK